MIANNRWKKYFLVILKQGLAPLLFPLLAQASSSAKISGVHLIFSCENKKCLEITSPSADIGQFNGSYAFREAVLTVTTKVSETTYHTTDMFYDHFTEKVYLHNITERPGDEAYYDLVKHQFYIIKK